jgi:putative MFS transporter
MNITIDQQIEKAKLSRFHFGLLALGSFIYAFTAMNVLLIAAVFTPIIAEFGLAQQPLAAGLLLSAGYIGMFVGALTCGALADRIGRKNTIIFTLFTMTVFTALNGFAPDPVTMAVLRFVAGIGLGGALPQPGVYIAEYVPAKYRGRFIGLTEASWVYGALLSLTFSVFLFPALGWRLTFLVSLIPLALVPAVYFFAPKSLRYLQVTGRKKEAVGLLKKYKLVTEDITEDLKATPAVRRGFRKTLVELWSPIFRKRTLMIWVSWAVLVYTYHGIFTWLPTFYYDTLGFTVVKSIQWVLIVTLAQVPGYLGAWSALYTYTPELYPTRIRGTASGAAASIGRLAGVVAPTATPLLYFYGGLGAAFSAFALIHFAGAITIAILGIETKGKPLTEISK